MRPVNALGVDTRHGFRTVDLFEGDITTLDVRTDVLVVSAFAGSYVPSRGTVIEALDRAGVDLRAYVMAPALDLRPGLATWVTPECSEKLKFRRILCVEILGAGLSIEDALDNVFASLLVMEAKGISTDVVAMPLLGTGAQRLAPAIVAKALIERARRFLQRSGGTSRLIFVELDADKAANISDAMDQILGRKRVTLPQEQLVEALRLDVGHRLHEATELFRADPHLRDDWLRLLQAEQVRASDFGIVGRKLVELLLNRRRIPQAQLYKRIRTLEDSGSVAPWICGYMHVLRHLGNESAHDTPGATSRQPSAVTGEDLITGLCCVLRLIEFWIEHGDGPQAA